MRVVPHDGTTVGNSTGDIEALNSNGKAYYYNGSQSGTSPIVTESHSATLINKAMDGDDNTFTNIPDSALAGNITRSKIAAGTANEIVVNDNSGLLSSTPILNVARGGSGAATLTGYVQGHGASAFTAASTVPRADIAAGTASQVVINDGAGALSSTAVLTVPNGGTGASTLTGYVKGAGTSTMTAAALIPRADVASGTANYVVINDGSGNLSQEAILAQTRGGTAQASYTAGDLLYANASANLTKLPIGSSGSFLTVSGSLPAWGTVSNTVTVLSKTANYSAQPTDDVIFCNATTAFQITLPSAASNSGKLYKIKKTDSTFNALTIADSGTYSTTLNTSGESVDVVSDGSAWQTFDRVIPSVAGTYTVAITGTTSNPTKGTVAEDTAYWYRQRNCIVIQYTYRQTGAGSAGSGIYLFNVPSGLTIDAAKLGTAGASGSGVVGTVYCFINSVLYSGIATPNNTTNIKLIVGNDTTALVGVGSAFGGLSFASCNYSFTATLPISGWNV